MKKALIAIILFIISTQQLNSQTIDTSIFNTLITKEPLPYKNKKGECLGGCTYESRGMGLVFYSVKLEKNINRISIEGKLFDPRSGIDSDGVYGPHIYLATPKKNKLTNIRIIAATYYRYQNDSTANIFPHRTGDFIIRTTFRQKDKLYFEDPMFWPIEISINKLLSVKKQSP